MSLPQPGNWTQMTIALAQDDVSAFAPLYDATFAQRADDESALLDVALLIGQGLKDRSRSCLQWMVAQHDNLAIGIGQGWLGQALWDAGLLKQLLERKVALPADTDERLTLLRQTIEGGQGAALEVLLGHGAAPDEERAAMSAVIGWAACFRHAGAVRTLVRHGFDPLWRDEAGLSALHWAAIGEEGAVDVGRFIQVVDTLLELGVPIDALTHQHQTPIGLSLLHGSNSAREQMAIYLLRKGADPTIGGDQAECALELAADDWCAEFLVEAHRGGVNMHWRDRGGRTLLHRACTRGGDAWTTVWSSKTLRAQSIPSSQPSFAWSKGAAQSIASALGSQPAAAPPTNPTPDSRTFARVLSLLHEAGIDVNAVDHEGESALFYLVRTGDTDRLAALLALGAETSITNHAGQTVHGVIDALVAEQTMSAESASALRAVLFGSDARREMQRLLGMGQAALRPD